MIALARVAIQSKIYESSASLVYRGIGMQDERLVVKMLKQDYPSPQELIRYKQEYEIIHSLNLEGVIKAYSLQEHQRTLVILLEDFGGESLNQWMHKSPETFCPMSLSQFLPLAIALTEILGRVHAANVIHKDINPGNIILNPETGVVKIIDFGIATQFNRTDLTFKSPHVLEGTLAYISPEQTGRMNRILDYRTDFYSLGVTFYELLTGHLPFSTTDILELVHCHIAKQPVSPHELNKTIPQAVSDIILKLMAKNAEDRYQSAWGIKADLESCAQQLAETGKINHIQLGLQDISARFQISQKLYGRDKEVATLLSVFNRVACSQNKLETSWEAKQINKPAFKAEMMLVSGYAGIGKSALVRELYKPITQKRGYFIWGKFEQFGRNVPYSAMVDALQKLVQQLLGEPEEQVQQWRERLLMALGSNAQIIIDVIPEIELIIGKQPPVVKVGATADRNRFNFIFQKFVRVFCSQEHPLTIFLDDLQWIDSATLELIELILLDEQTQFLFLIGAYRDNEVNSTHPLILFLEKLKKRGVVFQEIVLKPLTMEPLSQLLAETLHQDANSVRSLAQLVLRKTQGNPFFVGEFLRMLYGENLLSFDPPQSPVVKGSHSRAGVPPVERSGVGSKGGWKWNIAQIEAQNIAENVVELMLLELKKLPEVTQQILRIAACIGSKFDLETLSIVFNRSPKNVFKNLRSAIQVGLLQPLSELDENLLIQEYKFSHDRVQQVAYTLIDESQKQVVHLQIGRNLLKTTGVTQKSNQLFEIVDHLNHGINLIGELAERNQIARLNLIAGQKAKLALAYSVAKKYLTTTREWLATSSWQTNYHLTLELYTETTEVAYLCGDMEQVEHWFDIVLREAKMILDTIKVYEVKIQTYMAQSQILKAIDTALQVLQQLGISFPEHPTQSDIHLELEAIATLLSEKPISDLIHLPQMTDPKKLAAMRILSRISVAAYITTPNLIPLLAAKQVNLSILHGNASVSPFAYANFGIILCGMMGNIDSGYEFGQLALNLLSQLNLHSFKARTFHLVHYFITHRKKHTRESLEPLLEGYQSGLETGDLEFASYCAYAYCFQSFAMGKELVELEREVRTYSEVSSQIKQEVGLTWLQVLRQSILNLMECSDNPTLLIGEAYNEDKELQQQDIDGFVVFFVHFNKLFLCYLFSEYELAVENSSPAEIYLLPGRTTPLEPLYYLYDSLARLAIYCGNNAQVQEEILKKVAINQEKLKQWSEYAPMNHLHKYYLVQAETARVLGQLFDAENFYEQAIQGARENGYIQEEALAYELAAKHYLARDREKIAQTYMKEARYCYERWGATAKVKDLETRFPQLLPQSSGMPSTSIRTTSGTTSNTSTIAVDFAAVMKASQMISREIELEQLLSSLMKIVIENAGAETGFLILENTGKWTIEATVRLNNREENVYDTKVLQSIPIANLLPESIVNYTIRTHECVILNDATREGNFVNEPYIQHNRTQSILCLPLLDRGKLVGVMYLENQLATGVFTPERAQVLNLLSTQAAIAIENAKLYSKLREGESRMAQFLEAIPVAIMVVDAAGSPYYANRRRIQIVGKGVDPSITPDRFAEVYQFYQAGTDRQYPTEKLPIVRAMKGEFIRVDDMEIRQNNKIIPIEAWGTPVYDIEGNVAYAIVTFQDITERKRTEQLLADYNRTLEQQVAQRTVALKESEAALRDVYEELRLREQELRLITDALPVCISYVDSSQRYRFVNHTYETWFNCHREEILGKQICELVGEAAYQITEPYIERVLAGQFTTYEAETPYPFGTKYISSTFIPDFCSSNQVRGFYGLITDMSAQRNAELRERKRIEEASILEERNRMAREIHDTLAQAFTGILLNIGAATQVITDDLEATLTYLETVDELARTGLAEARRSVVALRPQLLEDGNLHSALYRLVTQMRGATDTALIYELKGTAYPLSAEVENNLLRIGQEALTNAIKYAHASFIRVELVYEDVQCVLHVRDDGIGFGVGTIPKVGGFGLLGMSERVESMGARLTIRSQPGQGTEIIVTVNRE